MINIHRSSFIVYRFISVFAGLFPLALAALLAACTGQEAGEGRPLIALSIVPQRWFANRVSGGRARTLALVKPGQDPHSYEPSPRQLAELARAGAWVLSGAEFETALRPKVAALFPSLALIDGTSGVRFRRVEAHAHGGEAPSGIEIDRHTWLGREPAKIMARRILEALRALDGANAAFYTQNCEALLQEIDETFGALEKELAPLRGRTVFVYHPAFGYFLDEFGLIQEAVESGGKEPSPRALARLIREAKAEGVRVIFVQAQFPAAPAQTAAKAIGGAVAPLDPLAEDWLANIRVMGGALKAALESPEVCHLKMSPKKGKFARMKM